MSVTTRVALCASTADLADPTRMGLEADTSLAQPWLATYAGALEARRTIAEQERLREAWVVSSNEVEAVNLAAALKADRPALKVLLVGDQSGSVRSCANAAGLDGILGSQAFALRFHEAQEQGKALQKEEAVARLAKAKAERDRKDGGPSQLATPVAEPTSAATLSAETANAPVPNAETANAPSGNLPRAGFLLTVVSGSGGAGKSTVAVLAAHLAARRGLRTALLDGDLQFGDMRELAGGCPQLSVEEALASPTALDAHDGEPLVLLSAPRSLERSEVVAERFGELITHLTGRFDMVVVNTGGSWSDQHAFLLERSAASVFLVDQRASSIRACRHALDLCLRCGIATGSFLLAVNRCTRHAPFTSIDVSSALHGSHVTELADGGREVEELLGSGLVDALIASGNGLCLSLDKMLDELLPSPGQGAAEAAGRSKVIARFGLAGAREREPKRSRKAAGKRSRRHRAAEDLVGPVVS